MLNPPQLSFLLVGSGVDAIPLSLEALPETPIGPEKRISGAAREAWTVICARRAETLAQSGYDPILLVCAVDSQIGRRIVTNKLGDLAPMCVCGPVVFTLNPDLKALEAELGQGVAKAISVGLEKIAPKPGEMRILFAVNGLGLDLRVVQQATVALEQPGMGSDPPHVYTPEKEAPRV